MAGRVPKKHRYRLRLVGTEGWIEGTWTAATRSEAEEIARTWAALWMRGRLLSIEEGQT